MEYIDSTSLDVLKRGRALVHEGWELLSSPLYGNFKPNQQPYRTLLLRKNSVARGVPDAGSLTLIEDAVRFYESSRKVMAPGCLAERIEKDFRYIDVALLEDTLREYGLLSPAFKSRRGG